MTRYRKYIAAGLGLFGSAAFAQGPLATTLSPERADLATYRWQARPVLIFAPDPEDPDLKDQLAEFRDARDGLAERDIVVLVDTDPEAMGRLRAGLAVEGFEVILVGKDGGVKLREDQPLTARALFDTIDAMPMRQREMGG